MASWFYGKMTYLVLITSLLVQPLCVAQERTWTDTNGRKITAELVDKKRDALTLKRSDGKTIRIKLDTLTDADAKWAVMYWDVHDRGKRETKNEVNYEDDKTFKQNKERVVLIDKEISAAAKNMGGSPSAFLYPFIEKGQDIDDVRDMLGKPESESFNKHSDGSESLTCSWQEGERRLYVTTTGQRINFVSLDGFSLEEIRTCKAIEKKNISKMFSKAMLKIRSKIIDEYQQVDYKSTREWGIGARAINGRIVGYRNGVVEFVKKDESGIDTKMSMPVTRLTKTDQILVKIYIDFHEIPVKEPSGKK